jgi:hypothetical protein
MASPAVHEVLKEEIDSLSEELAAEVLDFILFVKAQPAEELFLWQQVEVAQTYRQQHPDDVFTVTAEEWEEYSAYLEDEDG